MAVEFLLGRVLASHILTRVRWMVTVGWSGMMVRNKSRGRRGVGTAKHYCSAEREVVGVLNVLRRGGMCAI